MLYFIFIFYLHLTKEGYLSSPRSLPLQHKITAIHFLPSSEGFTNSARTCALVHQRWFQRFTLCLTCREEESVAVLQRDLFTHNQQPITFLILRSPIESSMMTGEGSYFTFILQLFHLCTSLSSCHLFIPRDIFGFSPWEQTHQFFIHLLEFSFFFSF